MELAQHFVERHGLDAARAIGVGERNCSALLVRLGLVIERGVIEHPCDRIGLRLRHAASVARALAGSTASVLQSGSSASWRC